MTNAGYNDSGKSEPLQPIAPRLCSRKQDVSHG